MKDCGLRGTTQLPYNARLGHLALKQERLQGRVTMGIWDFQKYFEILKNINLMCTTHTEDALFFQGTLSVGSSSDAG